VPLSPLCLPLCHTTSLTPLHLFSPSAPATHPLPTTSLYTPPSLPLSLSLSFSPFLPLLFSTLSPHLHCHFCTHTHYFPSGLPLYPAHTSHSLAMKISKKVSGIDRRRQVGRHGCIELAQTIINSKKKKNALARNSLLFAWQ